MNKLPKIVGETQINKVVKVEFIRDGGTHVVDVVVEKPSSNDPFDNSVDSKVKDSKSILGMHVQPLTPNLRKLYNISEEEKKGVVITKIDRNSIAGLIGVKPGDVVVQVNKHEIASESDFEKSLEKLKKDGKGSAVLLVSRGGNTSFITISLN